MEPPATPPTQPEPGPQNERRRFLRVMGGLTALMIVSLLAASVWPAPGVRVAETPPGSTASESGPEPDPGPAPAASPPPGTAGPTPALPGETQAGTVPPAPEPQPSAPAPQQPLPPLPEGEPSRLVEHGDRSCRQIALTYDAGSAADGAVAILDMLKRQGVTATFFLTGKWVEHYPEIAKRIAAEGHEIANHTYSHPDLTKLSPDQVTQEVSHGEEVIRKVTGRETRPLFREPYGAFDQTERRLVRKAGFSYSIYWDVDTLDWQFPGVDAEVKKLTEKTQNGSIVLMHLNVPDSAAASDRAIPMLREKGYKLVTVSQVLSCKGSP